jgi:hypothetical protein
MTTMNKDELPFGESDARANHEGYCTDEIANQPDHQVETKRFYVDKARQRYLLNLGALAERAGLHINENNRLEWKLRERGNPQSMAHRP